MPIHRFFKTQYPVRIRVWGVAFLFCILLISGCGGEETVNNPISGPSGKDLDFSTPTSTVYYPMTVGNRWVYRNPDGSEWAREVAETKKLGANDYHFFSSDPPLQDTRIESLRSPVYAAFLDRLDRKIARNDINAAVWGIIVESGGETPNWILEMFCDKWGGRKAVCVSTKDKSTPGILTYLYHYNARVTSHRLTLFPFPLVPGETYNALNLRLRGTCDRPFNINDSQTFHDFEAEVVVLGKIGDVRELVEVSAGAFEDCLKIQYEAKLASYRTVEFRDDGQNAKIAPKVYLKALESEIRKELTDLLMHLTSKLELQTVWLASGVGPVKIETPKGIAELIDYEVRTVASGQ